MLADVFPASLLDVFEAVGACIVDVKISFFFVQSVSILIHCVAHFCHFKIIQ